MLRKSQTTVKDILEFFFQTKQQEKSHFSQHLDFTDLVSMV